jgi:UDP-N-acetylglucosamine 4-epimerase
MYNKPFHPANALEKASFLVTGGAGFIGSHIVEYLLKYGAEKVRVMDNLSTGSLSNLESFYQYPAFEFMEGDIRNPLDCEKACEGIMYVTHQAALGSVPRSITNPVQTHEVNSSGFLNMLLAAKNAKIRKFIYASSSSVYGDNQDLPKTEDKIGRQLSPYAVSKRSNELYADVFSDLYGMRITGLRYFNVFGPRQSPEGPYAAAIPLFFDALLNNKAAYINGDGEQTRDFTFVENAVRANICAFFAEESKQNIFNIAVGETVSINSLFKSIQKLTSSEAKAIHRDSRTGDILNSLADISMAKKYLNYHPEIKVDEGLLISLPWYINQFKTTKNAI